MSDDLLRRARAVGGLDDDAVLISDLANEIERLREALREIASIDYRGNAHPSVFIARAALGEKE